MHQTWNSQQSWVLCQQTTQTLSVQFPTKKRSWHQNTLWTQSLCKNSTFAKFSISRHLVTENLSRD